MRLVFNYYKKELISFLNINNCIKKTNQMISLESFKKFNIWIIKYIYFIKTDKYYLILNINKILLILLLIYIFNFNLNFYNIIFNLNLINFIRDKLNKKVLNFYILIKMQIFLTEILDIFIFLGRSLNRKDINKKYICYVNSLFKKIFYILIQINLLYELKHLINKRKKNKCELKSSVSEILNLSKFKNFNF
uniref:Uncharacterized protein n=1 Tax=Vannella croatica TaxID=1778588 RepID=A0A2I6SRZ7_9EUKA|nr:hypothetical protein [Vannella croatica]